MKDVSQQDANQFRYKAAIHDRGSNTVNPFINGACDRSSCSTFEDSRQQKSFSCKRKDPGLPSEDCSALVATNTS